MYLLTEFVSDFILAIFYTLQVFLFAAWVCIVNYIDFILFDLAWGSYQFYVKWPGNWDLKADFFHGVTVACWVMVSILVLTSVLSLDKLCNRSSRWTLTVSPATVRLKFKNGSTLNWQPTPQIITFTFALSLKHEEAPGRTRALVS